MQFQSDFYRCISVRMFWQLILDFKMFFFFNSLELYHHDDVKSRVMDLQRNSRWAVIWRTTRRTAGSGQTPKYIFCCHFAGRLQSVSMLERLRHQRKALPQQPMQIQIGWWCLARQIWSDLWKIWCEKQIIFACSLNKRFDSSVCGDGCWLIHL